VSFNTPVNDDEIGVYTLIRIYGYIACFLEIGK